MTVTTTALWHEAVLDDAAICAERQALLAELAAEQYGQLHAHSDRQPDRDEHLTARLLSRAAVRARRRADMERRRCARELVHAPTNSRPAGALSAETQAGGSAPLRLLSGSAGTATDGGVA